MRFVDLCCMPSVELHKFMEGGVVIFIYVAVCCIVLQCLAVSCRVWQCLAVSCRVWQCLAVSCRVWQCLAYLHRKGLSEIIFIIRIHVCIYMFTRHVYTCIQPIFFGDVLFVDSGKVKEVVTVKCVNKVQCVSVYVCKCKCECVFVCARW